MPNNILTTCHLPNRLKCVHFYKYQNVCITVTKESPNIQQNVYNVIVSKRKLGIQI